MSNLAELAYDLRIACMRLVRRVRYNTDSLAPHFFSVLASLEGGCATTAAGLAEHERVSAPSMSRTVAELADRGLLERTTDPDDRRRQLLTVTDAGREALRSSRRERDQWMVARMEQLSPEELAVLEQAAAIIATMLDDRR